MFNNIPYAELAKMEQDELDTFYTLMNDEEISRFVEWLVNDYGEEKELAGEGTNGLGFDRNDLDFSLFEMDRVDEMMLKKYGVVWIDVAVQILEAAESGVERLNLSCKDLPIPPSCIGKCVDLIDLRVHGKQLLTLPRTIGLLTKLTKLTTYCSQVRFYPYELVHCKLLDKVGGNRLYIDLSSLCGRYPYPDINDIFRVDTKREVPSLFALASSEVAKYDLDLIDSLPSLIKLKIEELDFSECSFCHQVIPTHARRESLVWTSRRWGGDPRGVLPLLGKVCSDRCRELICEGTIQEDDLSGTRMTYSPGMVHTMYPVPLQFYLNIGFNWAILEYL